MEDTRQIQNTPIHLDGYSLIQGPGNQTYLVPTFWRSETESALDALKMKQRLSIGNSSGGVGFGFPPLNVTA
jgi:hypothetical protein